MIDFFFLIELFQNTDQLEVLAHLSDYHVYWTLNARKQFRAPTEWGICLRPSSKAEAEETAGGELRCITFDNEKARSCWIIAMRLAKVISSTYNQYLSFHFISLFFFNLLYSILFFIDYYYYSKSWLSFDFSTKVFNIVDETSLLVENVCTAKIIIKNMRRTKPQFYRNMHASFLLCSSL